MKKLLSLLILATLCGGVSLKAEPCGGVIPNDSLDGSLEEVAYHGLNTGFIQALTSYQCDGTCYVVSGGENEGGIANIVYKVNPDGSLMEVPYHGLNTGIIRALDSYECNDACYVVSGGADGSISNVVYEVNPDTGQLIEVPYHGLNAGVIETFTSYECDGRCYVVSGGVNEGGIANIVYKVNPDGSLMEVPYHGLNDGNIQSLTSYECNGICYVVSGGADGSISNVVYEVNPGTGQLMEVPYHGLNDAVIEVLTSYDCRDICYVVSGGEDAEDSNVVYRVDPVTGQLMEIPYHGLNTGNIEALTSYECGGICFVISGGTSEGVSNVVYEVDPDTGQLIEVQDNGLNDGEIRALTSYQCCFQYVVSGGEAGATSNVVYLVQCGIFTLNNICTCVDANSDGNVIDVSEGHCTGCFDEMSVTIVDENGVPVEIPYTTPLGGLVNVDESGTVTYNAPISCDCCTSDCFFFTATDCCGNDLGCAKVTIFVKPICDLEIACAACTFVDFSTVTIGTNGGKPPLEYSLIPILDGATNDSGDSDGVYTDVVSGVYLIKVSDALGCLVCDGIVVREGRPSSSPCVPGPLVRAIQSKYCNMPSCQT